MKNKNIHSNTELPSKAKLIKSTILAILLAAIILVTVVLPAEYGIDPTGIGSIIGLVKMGEIKVSLAQEAEAERANTKVQKPIDNIDSLQTSRQGALSVESISEEVTPQSEANVNSDQITLSLSPNEGKEVKLTMKKGEQINFVWWTDSGKANFDAHGDSKKLKIKYHNYEKGYLERSEGVLEAAFDGKHGWFWRNRTSENMTVTLQVNGEFSDLKQIK